MSEKVKIAQDECIGCEACGEICPAVFGFDEDEGTAHVIDGTDADDPCVDEAIASCPAACIHRE